MTEDDFDKDVENEEFADEFDFVDEDDTAHAQVPGNEMPPPNRDGAANKSAITYTVIAVVVIVGGYLGYKFMAAPPEKPATTAASTPLPPPTAMPDATAMDQTMPPAAATAQAEGSVDFNQTFDQAASAQDQLSNALPPPQTKSFDQVQRELKGAPGKTINSDAINATLDSISEEMTLNVNQMKHLEATITSLASTVDQLNKSISAMDNRVLGLTETVDGLANDLSNVKKIMADEDIDLTATNKVRFSGKKQVVNNNTSPEYTVHAVIPGRAWLKTSSGQIITVTEGDKVGDFGTVAVIDAANGVVRTSSGITFR